MKVISIEEREDGSALVKFDMTEEEKSRLIEYAVVDLLDKYVEKQGNKND